MNTNIITHLSQIAGDYDAILCDVWGVIHNGVQPFKESVDALRRFRQTRGPVVLITNSPRPASEIPAQFAYIGVADDCYDAIITSGDASRQQIQMRAPGPVYVLGPKRDMPLYEGLGLEYAELETARFISCTGLFEDRDETPEDYRDLLAQAQKRALPMVCVNPDITVMIGEHRVWCGGALAQIYENMGGEVIYSGKPHAPIYDLCYAKLKQLSAKQVTRSRILAIGDGIGTDILGADTAKIDSLFVATGIDADALDDTGALNADKLMAKMSAAGTRTRYGAPGLVW